MPARRWRRDVLLLLAGALGTGAVLLLGGTAALVWALVRGGEGLAQPLRSSDSVELTRAGQWPVGTCLRSGPALYEETGCDAAHDAEVVLSSPVVAGHRRTARQEGANAFCATAVATLAERRGLPPGSVTHASAWPGDDAHDAGDHEVRCLLVGVGQPLVGSLTAGDLRDPVEPVPLE
ncbi:septum formation family protein [Kineococcus sp. G2]|uniref:septum formation family protein n=1 Tax=Kineococcus sp. G2 TaxID=3127484 RepID=UPI00301D67D6